MLLFAPVLIMFSKLREDIKSIIERDPAARNGWEVLTCYPGLHAVMMHGWAHACWLAGFKWAGRFISYFARVITGIEIHPGAIIGRRVFIDHGFGVVIGETAVVGDDCTIYQGVTLGGTTLVAGTKRHPTLERGVIVGAGAQVLGAFTVGELPRSARTPWWSSRYRPAPPRSATRPTSSVRKSRRAAPRCSPPMA
jgi:serine O-acetyltransferase